MSEYITNELIIDEYLNNWFNEEELAKYLCINIEDVNKALISSKDKKILEKIITHRKLLNLYKKKINGEIEQKVEGDNCKIVNIGKYIVNNHCSIRKCANDLGYGKTTIFDYIHQELPYLDILLYKQVFDILMENKSFSTNNKRVIEQVLSTYQLLLDGYTIKEISEILGLGWNVIERNLNIRLKKIDKEKYEIAKMLLESNQKDVIKDYEFESKGK